MPPQRIPSALTSALRLRRSSSAIAAGLALLMVAALVATFLQLRSAQGRIEGLRHEVASLRGELASTTKASQTLRERVSTLSFDQATMGHLTIAPGNWAADLEQERCEIERSGCTDGSHRHTFAVALCAQGRCLSDGGNESWISDDAPLVWSTAGENGGAWEASGRSSKDFSCGSQEVSGATWHARLTANSARYDVESNSWISDGMVVEFTINSPAQWNCSSATIAWSGTASSHPTGSGITT